MIWAACLWIMDKEAVGVNHSRAFRQNDLPHNGPLYLTIKLGTRMEHLHLGTYVDKQTVGVDH